MGVTLPGEPTPLIRPCLAKVKPIRWSHLVHRQEVKVFRLLVVCLVPYTGKFWWPLN